MARPKAAGTTYKRADGKWVAQMYVDDPRTGDRRKVRRYASTESAAKRLLTAMRAETPQVTAASLRGVTVAAYLDVWAAETLPTTGVTESTQAQYRSIITTPLKPTLGNRLLSTFTPREAERWVARLDQATTKRGTLLSQSTKRTAYAVLTLALDTAVRDRLIVENPLKEIRRPKKAATVVPVLTADEVDRLLDAAAGTHAEALIVLVANTGCRIGEALALRWDDVDLDASTATIRRASIMSATTKTAAGVRTVPLLPEVVAALKVRRSQQRADRLKMGPGWADTEGLVFTTGAGTPVDAHNARRSLRAVLKAAGLPQDRPWHTMRHSLATRLLNRGVPMPVVASILGHASIRTTVDIYGHAEPAINADALAEVMGR